MSERTVSGFPDDLQEAHKAATQLIRDARFREALDESRDSLELRREATRNPFGFLEARGLDLPPNLAIRFGQRPRPFQPTPDWEAFSLRLFDCRTYWIYETDPDTGERRLTQQEICWGFELVPNPVPGGPVGAGPRV
jgi:hypothetical protein